MKACRVIKIIAFIIALLLTAVAVAGNVLIIRDSCVYYTDAESDTKVSVQTILDDLQGQKFRILPASANAEGEASVSVDNAPEIEISTDPTASPEATTAPTETPSATFEAAATEQPVESAEPTETAETVEAAEVTKKVYNISNHHYLLISLMKAGSERVSLGFLKCLNDVKVFGAKILSDVDYSVNLCALIAFCLFFVAFILHLFSKNVTKTFYGILLMILGYLLFVVFVFAGVVISSKVYQLCQTLEAYHKYLARLYTATAFIAIGVLFGLPYFRCGSRQMKMKEMKEKIKKLRRKSAR